MELADTSSNAEELKGNQLVASRWMFALIRKQLDALQL